MKRNRKDRVPELHLPATDLKPEQIAMRLLQVPQQGRGRNFVPKAALCNCLEIVKTMRQKKINYNDACKDVAKNKPVCTNTIRDACCRFGRGKGELNPLSVPEIERQVRTGEIESTLKEKFPEYRGYIESQLGT